ncbi:MAG: DUF4349 domain-containing protein, partial [Coriobacteriia bacterium]|nr:DUF4349 domain-containing protein [Coriobacteriia bacterium]
MSNTRTHGRQVRFSAVLILILVALASSSLVGCGIVGSRTESGYDEGKVGPAVEQYAEESYLYAEDAVQDGAPMTRGEVSESSIVPSPGTGVDAAQVPEDERLLIRRVDMRLRVDEIAAAVDEIRAAVEGRGGTVIDLNVSTDEEPIYRYAETPLNDGAPLSGYLTVRVPADALDAFLDDMAAVGTVLREAENQSDVTQEHIDLKARLTNLEATEARLRDFMEQAKNVTEMLAVEQELSRVRGDIESMRAQIAYLERQAAHSTVTIELTGPKPIVRPGGEDWGFSAALTESVRA